ncbi:MAG: AAA-like domain-containing protein, partial [Cyanobacteria bacterium J06631_12]
MTQRNIYTVGGTVQAGNGIYIPRKADRQLLQLCQERTFSYVLSPRQLGKSSLMVQTAESLRQEGVRTAIIDLQPIGVQLSAEEWYLGLLTELEDQFELDVDLLDWWEAHEHLGLSQRMTRFFSDVILTEIEEPIVVFVDEIDTTLSLDFTDDFFIAIRYFYTARAQNPAFNRLSFVLIGVATPADLIRNPQRTPFNVGERVDVTDFTLEEALPLAAGFGISDYKAERLLERILDWTGGHPYLTQRLCQAVTESKQADAELSEDDIDRVVATTFFGSMSDRDNNLQFVRDMLTQRAPDLYSTLTIYKDIWREKTSITDEEQSLIKSHLKLSGVVKRDADKTLHVRNAIYRHVFNEAWIRDNLPINWRKRVRQLQGAVAAGLLLMTAMSGLTYWAFSERQRAEAALARVGEERDRAEAEAAKARKSSAEAFLQRQEAEEQREEANKQQTLAEERRKEAEEGRKAEEAAKQQALLAEQQAEEGQRVAEEATGQALLAKQSESEQRKIAELQEEEAKSNLSTMTRLIDDVFSLVQGDQNIGIVGFSQFQRSLFDSLLDYHDYIVSNRGQPASPWQRAQARYRIGRSSEIVGDSIRAQDEYQAAFEETISVATAIYSSENIPLDLVQLLNETAVYYAWNLMNYGNNDKAREIISRVKSISQESDREERPGLLRAFASVENAHAQLLSQEGEHEGAYERQLSALDFARRAVALDRNNIELRRTLAVYLRNLSKVNNSMMSEEEKEHYEALGCKLARDTDELAHSGAALINVIASCTFDESLEGEVNEVIESLLNVRKRLDVVVQLDPENIEFKLSRARINTRLMFIERIHRRNSDTADNYFSLALADWLDVVGNGDTFPTEIWQLRAVYIDLKDHILAFDDDTKKLEAFNSIVFAIDRTNKAFGDAPEVALIAANSMSELGVLQKELNPEESLRNFNKSIDSFLKA